MPPVAEVLEQSVEEISLNGNSVAVTVLLDLDSETQNVIISSQQNCDPRDSRESSGDGLEGALYPAFSSQPSSTSIVPTHASKTPSKKSMPQSRVYTSSESIGCKLFMRGVNSPRSSSETLGRQQSLAVSNVIAGKGLHFAGCSNSFMPSIYDNLLNLGSHRAGRNKLKNVDLASFSHQKVNYLPMRYNGDIVFELPPLPNVKGGGAAMLEGMDKRRDGYAWTETATTNIIDPDGQLSFRYMKCLGHLRCQNILCPHLEQCGDYNEKYWEGSSSDVLIPGPFCEVSRKSSVLGRICKSTPTCLKLCFYKMYYTTSKNPEMSRTCVHFRTHEHPIATRDCSEAMEDITTIRAESGNLESGEQ